HDERDLGALALDRREDILLPQSLLALARNELENGTGGIEAVKRSLRLHRVLIRRERASLDQDLEALLRRPVERGHDEVEIHRKRIHRDDFALLRAHEPRERTGQELMVRKPRV